MIECGMGVLMMSNNFIFMDFEFSSFFRGRESLSWPRFGLSGRYYRVFVRFPEPIWVVR